MGRLGQYALTGTVLAVTGVTFWASVRFLRLSLPLAMLTGAVLGSLAGGFGVPFLYLVEGSFTYLYVLLMIITGTLFVTVLREGGGLVVVARDLLLAFRGMPRTLVVVLTFLVALPGAFTGSGTEAVLTLGGLVGTVLLSMGIPHQRAAAIVAMGGVVGLVAPPVNIPAMAIAGGINMPYVGFFAPLLLLSLVVGVSSALLLGGPYVGGRPLHLEDVLRRIPPVPAGVTRLHAYLPLGTVILWMAAPHVFPRSFPDVGAPLIFISGTLVAWSLGRRVDLVEAVRGALRTLLPVSGLLIAIGSLVEILTLTGVRGLLVIGAIVLPELLLYAALLLVVPLSGGVLSAFGAGAVLGIPFVLALLEKDAIMSTAGVSLLASLGSMVPPSALVGAIAAQAVGYPGRYSDILKACALPMAVAGAAGILTVWLANPLAAWLR